MPRLLGLLVIFSVLWCGLHLMEPAGTAPGLADSHEIAAGDAPGDCHDSGAGSGKAAHSSHHHCPVAPEPRLASADTAARGESLFFAGLTARMPSLAEAPPLEPPTA
jgi:hypothetical protein